MRSVEGHHDFGRLEARLFRLIREVKEGGPSSVLAPILIVVPTARLRSYLQVLLAREFGALLNVSILHHRALASDAAAHAGAALPEEIPGRVREAILQKCLGKPFRSLSDYLASCPGALSSLLATMDDLRDAGVEPAAARKIEGIHRRGREILQLYAVYTAALARLAARGLADRAGVMEVASEHAAAFARRFRLVIHYGAYELIGSNLDFMKRVESAGVRTVYLIPSHPTAAAFAFSRRFQEEFLGGAAALPPDEPAEGAGEPPSRILGARLPHLYEEEAPDLPPLEGEGVRFFHAQGAAAELRETALRILELVDPKGSRSLPWGPEGPSLSRIAIVARSLEPYASLLRPILHERFKIPFTTTASTTALRDPHVQATLRLAGALISDYERQDLLDLARSGLLLVDGDGGSPASRASAWDHLGRQFRITRGKDAWTRELARAVDRFEPWVPADAGDEERAAAARRKGEMKEAAGSLARLVGALDEDAAPLRKASTWNEWAAAFGAILQRRISFSRTGDDPAPGAGVVLEALREMGRMDEAGHPFSGPEALAFLQRALSEARIGLGSVGGHETLPDNGGVRVLDAMQARGLSFDTVFLIGFNADLFPRRPREDPFLGDGDRTRLREGLARPVPVSSSGREEEHLLLSHILGSAKKLLTISWQRADETGRAKVPSLALREVSRLTLGTADFAAPLQAEASHRVATHPADVTREIRDGFAFIPPRDARLGAVLEVGSPGRVKGAASSLAGAGDLPFGENLEPGLSLLEAVESFSPADLRYDAVVGQAAPSPSTWSPTRLETLGSCPQQYFFRHVLRVEEMEEILPEHEIDPGELGLLAHRVLHRIYKRLLEEGALSRPGAEPEQAARRGMELLEEIWSAQAEPTAGRVHRRYPLLWSALSALWKNALQTFLLHDITDLETRGSRLLDLERAVEVEIGIGLDGDDLLPIRGRFDRVLRDAAGRPVVGDYKTMGSLEKRVDPRTILKGRALQMPLYVLMEEAEARSQGRQGAGVTAEVIGVGPAFSEGAPPVRPNPEGYPARETLSPKIFDRYREGILETLGILIRTAAIGAFPLNSRSDRCAWCPFTRACRKDHAPTLARLEGAAEAAAYLSLDGKSTRAPLVGPAGHGGRGGRGGRQA